MAAKYPSSIDQDSLSFHRFLQLCPKDQQNPGSCRLLGCNDLHMCAEYLLTSKCKQFELYGKCLHSHSFFTAHNQKILEKKYRLSLTDEHIFEKVSNMLQISMAEKLHSADKIPKKLHLSFAIKNDHDNHKYINVQPNSIAIGRGHNGLAIYKHSPEPSSSRGIPLSLSNHHHLLPALDKRNTLTPRSLPPDKPSLFEIWRSKSIDLSSQPKSTMTSRSLHVNSDEADRSALTSHFTNGYTKNHKKEHLLSSSSSKDERVDSSREAKSFAPFSFNTYQHKKEKNSPAISSHSSLKLGPQIKSIFDKYHRNDELCFLHGPARRHLVEHDNFQISPSGYYRFRNFDEEKRIEKRLDSILSSKLDTHLVQLPTDEVALIIFTPTAESFFEEIQLNCAIISQTYRFSFDIEVIYPPTADQMNALFKTPASVNGKFHVTETHSSIDVVYGNIAHTQVDMMVCVTTSATLLSSVIAQAGSKVKSEYEERAKWDSTMLLDGGNTSARKIFFISWELEVRSANIMQAQLSLSGLVKRCIDEACRLNMKSISFPLIGTGEIGLSTAKVCEAMVGAASERLHRCTLDVIFVIYSSGENKYKNNSYQIFRTYLNDLRKQKLKSMGPERSSTIPIASSALVPIPKSQYIRRIALCKHIATISSGIDIVSAHRFLVTSLEKLIVQKTYDLFHVQPVFTNQIQLLINVCLKYQVLPFINFPTGELVLRGDRESCSQCFANIRKPRLISKYSILYANGHKSEEMKLNTYVSLKIDEARSTNDSRLRIQDDGRNTFDFDLKTLKAHVNGDVQPATLHMKQLNIDLKTVPPTNWSRSPLMIRTIEISHSLFTSMECVRLFEETMPRSSWHIERIDTIENWPLYVHYIRKKDEQELLVFHGCSYSSVQSVIHYGLHSIQDSICLTRDALNSHIYGARRSSDGKYYMFVVHLSKKMIDQELFHISNKDAHLAFPTHLIVYKQ
ncbi:unnamed protein product [Adineta steineri]|uniref:Macro domain-containing protein n=1 Tax=Adineta steineri TaxID=433720 RepID=A0A818W7Z3_9BILA|nr:unnamed protein product [Adineta steineri]CAF3721622.1 unnamed protein product [Adineta steineri]